MSPGHFVEALSLSRMRLSQMDGGTHYSLEYAESDTVDPNATFSPDSTPRGSGAFRFSDLNTSPDLCHRVPGSNAGHVTDGTGLPSSLFSGDSRSAHQVFSSVFGVSMGDEDDAEDEEGEEVLIDADIGVTTTKKRKKPTASTHGPRWKALEDECLINSFKVVSFCPITGANQTPDKYYRRLLD
ncbi:hypothetical protein QYE76_038119 [Lolium multiflorum]|uniref:Uncharacterized protein n=1 Tax=Lolium multiflorum TaxID=4521 RepID=A0AAD8T7E6_LOLMU|nr:hypothetical protein QYE76_038119 [Lolium multiflorum]